jgi:hypothetical protein
MNNHHMRGKPQSTFFGVAQQTSSASGFHSVRKQHSRSCISFKFEGLRSNATYISRVPHPVVHSIACTAIDHRICFAIGWFNQRLEQECTSMEASLITNVPCLQIQVCHQKHKSSFKEPQYFSLGSRPLFDFGKFLNGIITSKMERASIESGRELTPFSFCRSRLTGDNYHGCASSEC